MAFMELSCFVDIAVGPDRGQHVRYAALTCGVVKSSPVVCVILEGAKGGVTSQIAVKLAMDAITAQVVGEQRDHSTSERILELALSEANARVYEYAARMLSGVKVTATGCLSAFDGQRLTLGRTGNFEAVIRRNGSVSTFFQKQDQPGVKLERLIGAEKRLLIDFASVGIVEGDTVVISNLGADGSLASLTAAALEQEINASELANFLVAQSLLSSYEASSSKETFQPIVCVLQFEPPPIYLQEVHADT